MIGHPSAERMARSLATHSYKPEQIFRAVNGEWGWAPALRQIEAFQRKHVEEPFWHMDQSRNSQVKEHDPFQASDDMAEACTALREALIREHGFTLRILQNRHGRKVVW